MNAAESDRPTGRRRRAAPLRRWGDEAVIAGLLAALAAGVALGGWALRLDRVVYDGGLTLWRRPPPPGIVIVAIDDASVQAIGRWPWKRAVHATLLQQLAKARPRAIALDLLLSEPDPDPEQDHLLALALQAAAPVVLPTTWQGDGAGGLAPLDPAPTLRAAAQLGASEASLESDGVLRDTFLRTRAAGDPGPGTPSLALALLEAGGETVHPRTLASVEQAGVETLALPAGAPGSAAPRQPGGRGAERLGRLAIRYTGPPDTVDRVPYAEVLAGTVPAERLAGRYVLVGMTAQGLGDTIATPVNSLSLAMPGVEMHANALYTLRSGDSITTVDAPRVAAGSALLVVLLLAAFRHFGPRVALPLAVGSVPLAVLCSLLALRSGLWFSPVPYALAAVLAYPLWSWRRLERTVRSLDGEIALLNAADPLHGTPAAARAQRARRTDGDVLDARLHTLRRAGAVVREARRFLGDALAGLPTAMLVADGRARVVLANPRAAALFDVETPDELRGLDLARLLGEFSTAEGHDWPTALAALTEHTPDGQGIAVEVRLGGSDRNDRDERRTDGQDARRDFVVHVAAVDVQGLRRLIVSIADIEPVKQAQREREDVLAFVSHDLRSPANAIVLLADLNLQGHLQTPQPELLQEMRRLAARTLALSDGLVRAAQAQTQALQRETVDLTSLLAEVATDLHAQALSAGVTVHTQVTPSGASVAADRLLLARALGNLVSNALKHGPAGSRVDLQAEATEGTDGRVRLSVRDHGPGLSPHQLAQLARGGEGAAVGDARGVGLGLLFVQRVALRHGGSLRASPPADGSGTLMTIVLPA